MRIIPIFPARKMAEAYDSGDKWISLFLHIMLVVIFLIVLTSFIAIIFS